MSETELELIILEGCPKYSLSQNEFISLNAFRSRTKSRTSTVITPMTSNDSIQNHFKPLWLHRGA